MVEVGADAGELAPGTRVVINPLLTCGTCELCLRGQSNICLNREIVGAQRPGGMADFVVVPATNAVPISDALSDVEASLVEPLAVSIRAVELADAGYLDRAVVIGAGNIGLLVPPSAGHRGVGEILTVDTHPTAAPPPLGSDPAMSATRWLPRQGSCWRRWATSAPTWRSTASARMPPAS